MAGGYPRLFPSKATCCDADVTKETAMIHMPRGPRRVMRRAKQIHHVRAGIPFWHWSDTEVVEAPVFETEQGLDRSTNVRSSSGQESGTE